MNNANVTLNVVVQPFAARSEPRQGMMVNGYLTDKRMWRLLILLSFIRLSVSSSVDHCALSPNGYRGRLADVR
jgi:hypothetical protein